MNQAEPYGMHMQPQHTVPSYTHPAPQHYYSQMQSSQPYGGYGYAHPSYVTSPQSAGSHMQNGLPLPGLVHSNSYPHAPQATTPAHPAQFQQPYDTTGQIAPPGMKPRVTATLWEDEGSLCFQVEAKGVCVARREDNHFINGTKLLNVAGMTRGRRDGILKSEKVRHVVKIGPMHLKGVWIPFDRALEFANKEKITDSLYPLFVQNIGSLLYNPENSNRTNAVVSASQDRRRDPGSDGSRPSTATAQPSLHHHHSMNGNMAATLPSTPHAINPQANGVRPGIDRAHTFPTPPTSASSVPNGGMVGSGSYDGWSAQSMPGAMPSAQNGLSIDTTGGMTKTHSMPTTPATTPPNQSVAAMQPYPASQGYDPKGQYYAATTPSSTNGYAHPGARYDTGFKNEMGPPTAPNTGNTESAAADGYRPQYAYNPAQDGSNVSPEMNSSPHHGSGRGTPRMHQNSASHWTPPGTHPGSMYDGRSSSNPENAYPVANNYQQVGGNKRRRDDDDGDDRPETRDYNGNSLDGKRQKMRGTENFGMPLPTNTSHAIKSGR